MDAEEKIVEGMFVENERGDNDDNDDNDNDDNDNDDNVFALVLEFLFLFPDSTLKRLFLDGRNCGKFAVDDTYEKFCDDIKLFLHSIEEGDFANKFFETLENEVTTDGKKQKNAHIVDLFKATLIRIDEEHPYNGQTFLTRKEKEKILSDDFLKHYFENGVKECDLCDILLCFDTGRHKCSRCGGFFECLVEDVNRTHICVFRR